MNSIYLTDGSQFKKKKLNKITLKLYTSKQNKWNNVKKLRRLILLSIC